MTYVWYIAIIVVLILLLVSARVVRRLTRARTKIPNSSRPRGSMPCGESEVSPSTNQAFVEPSMSASLDTSAPLVIIPVRHTRSRAGARSLQRAEQPDHPKEDPKTSLEPEPLDRGDLSRLLIRGTVTFDTLDHLRMCECVLEHRVRQAEGSARLRSWGDCAVPGPHSIVLHAVDGTNEWAVKVYAPSGKLDAHELASVDAKLRSLDLGCFPHHSFVPGGLHINYESATYPFHVGMMPWLRSEREVRLDEFVETHRGSRVALVTAAAALRVAFAELARNEVAHGDICAANIVLALRTDGAIERANFLDTDTLTWFEHSSIAKRIIGQPGYYTGGRLNTPAEYVEACMGTSKHISMIDAPAALITYLSMLAYAVAEEDALPDPERTLVFHEDDVLDPKQRRIRMTQLRELFAALSEHSIRVERLLDALEAHCASTIGIDTGVAYPFNSAAGMASLAKFESIVIASLTTRP